MKDNSLRNLIIMVSVLFIGCFGLLYGMRIGIRENIANSGFVFLIALGFLTTVNSDRHTELGRLFQIKRELPLFNRIDYRRTGYENLPVIFIWIIVNFLLSSIVLVSAIIFKTLDINVFLVAIICSMALEFLFTITEFILSLFTRISKWK